MNLDRPLRYQANTCTLRRTKDLHTTLTDSRFTNLSFSRWNHIFFNTVFHNLWLTKQLWNKEIKGCLQYVNIQKKMMKLF